jgi:hypothetical protein
LFTYVPVPEQFHDTAIQEPTIKKTS